MNIPHEDSVAVRICYNGRIHHAVCLLGEEAEGKRTIYIFGDSFPPGYHVEHLCHQIDWVIRAQSAVDNPSGESAWFAYDIIDLDLSAYLPQEGD